MILTVTMNASVDITYVLTEFMLNQTNRVTNVKKTAGGKGLNVTRVLKQVGGQVLATGLAGGTTGQFICEQLNSQQISQAFHQISVESRNNLSIIDSLNQTEILESGPNVPVEELKAFESNYLKLLEQVESVVLSGSLPQGVPASYYGTLIQQAKAKGKIVILDTSGKTLQASLTAKPTLIKPNKPELEELLGYSIDSTDIISLKKALLMEQFADIEWVVLSLGAAGGIVKRQSDFYQVTVPKIEALNPIGSGDSTIAGFALGLDQQLTTEKIIRQGMTYGVLNALEHEPGCLKLSALTTIQKQIKISKL